MAGGAARVALAVGAFVHFGASAALAVGVAAWPWLDPGAALGFRAVMSGVGGLLGLAFGLFGAVLAGFAAVHLPSGGAARAAAFAAGGLLLLSCWPVGLLVLGLLAREDPIRNRDRGPPDGGGIVKAIGHAR